jgi:hypothetical protein
VSRFHSLSLLALFLAASALGCDKVPLTSPTGSTVTLTISNTAIPINGTAEVLAAVIESGGTAVHDGTMVTFSGSFGRFTPGEAPTVAGVARTTFTGTTSGTAKIGAFSGAAKATELEVKVGAAATERVTVRTEPTSVPQAGGTVQVIATVNDISGNPLTTAPVSFTTDNGSLSSSSGVTDANGEVRVSLTTSRISKVTAISGAKTSEFTVGVVSAPTVTITSSTTTPAVGVPVTFTITPTVPSGGAPIQNVRVNFGDGNTRDLGNVTGQTAVVNTFSAPGVYTVVATATDATGQAGTGSIAINVQRLLPNVTLVGLPATATVGATVSGTVTASAANGGPALQSVQVTQGGTVIYNGTGGGGFSRQLTAPGTYTFQATATDLAGTQATTTAVVVVNGGASPTINFTQANTAFPPAAIGTNEGFTISTTAATGLTIRSVVVVLLRTGDTIYNQSGGGTFATNNVRAGDVLRATVTDSAGSTSTFDLVVQ